MLTPLAPSAGPTGGAGVANQSDILPLAQQREQMLLPQLLIMFKVADHRLFDTEMIQQLHGHARILGGDKIHRLQRFDRAGRYIAHVADRRADDV